MKVSIYKAIDGEMSVLIQARVGAGRAPLVLQGVTKENLKKEVGDAITAMKGPRYPEEAALF